MFNLTANTTTNPMTSHHQMRSPLWLRLTHTIGISLIMVIILIGNSFEAYCLVHIREMRTVTGIFLLNLALTDLSVGVFSIPLSITASLNHELLHRKWFCDFSGCTLLLFVIASIQTLAAISVQKYMTVGYNRQGRFTRKLAKQVIAGIWVVALVLTVAPTLGWAHYTYSTGGYQCAPYSTDAVGHTYTVLLILVVFFLPLSILSYCNCKLYLITRNHIRTIKSRTVSQGRRTLSETRMIYTLMIIMLCFILCWFPVAVFYILKVANIEIRPGYETIFVMFAYGNSALNPIIYALRHETFRRGCKNVIRNICASNEVQPSGIQLSYITKNS